MHVCVHLLKNQTTETLYTPKPNLSKNACIQERSGPSPWPPASHQKLAPANTNVSMTRDRNLRLAPQPKSFMKTYTERPRHCPQPAKEETSPNPNPKVVSEVATSQRPAFSERAYGPPPRLNIVTTIQVLNNVQR